jgi:hypothetical protein
MAAFTLGSPPDSYTRSRETRNKEKEKKIETEEGKWL